MRNRIPARLLRHRIPLFVLVCPLVLACGGVQSKPDAGDPAQTPPTTGTEDMDAWLATGAYQHWHCETAVHAARSPSPHGYNRICSNDALSADAQGTGNWPAGAAAVKELYGSLTASAPNGHAVYLKTQSDSAAGANWYWYERTSGGVSASGFGNEGTAKSLCVGCHMAAGTNEANTPSAGARDFVFTPVP